MSILDDIRAKQAAKKAEQIRDPRHALKPDAISLKGTGITKREAEKNERLVALETKKSLGADKSLFVASAEAEFRSGVEATIAEMKAAQAKGDIEYDDSQLKAIAGILHNKVSVLIGAAGTGKTTVTKKIVSELAARVSVISMADVRFVTVDDEQGNAIRISAREAQKRKLLTEVDARAFAEEMPGIAFCAYTGRATQQLKRALPQEWHKNTSTIHSLLGYAPVFEEVEDIDIITNQPYQKTVKRFRPSFGEACKLPYTVFVHDETSMEPIPLWNEFIAAIHPTSRILLIGDIHQLPPVYGKSVLGYAMRKWPVFELTTIHRQAAGNAIIKNAHNVLKGRPLENASNFNLIGTSRDKVPSPTGEAGLQTYMLRVVKKLADMKLYNPITDAIIVPQNKSMVGCDELNMHFVTMFNPEIKENGIIINKRVNIHTGTGHAYFAVRDKVMITSNINTVEPPITNGMVGMIETINVNGKYDMKRSQVDFGEDNSEIDLDMDAFANAFNTPEAEKEKKEQEDAEDQRQSSHVMTIRFENGQVYTCSTSGDYRRVTHGYAATCHKSQGGEYPNIIILCHSVNGVMLSQEWLYTAITRARHNVYIICNDRGLQKALKRQVIKGNTLAEKIKSYVIETKSDEDGFDTNKYPILWTPEEV